MSQGYIDKVILKDQCHYVRPLIQQLHTWPCNEHRLGKTLRHQLRLRLAKHITKGKSSKHLKYSRVSRICILVCIYTLW
jgi:hypothetical protein